MQQHANAVIMPAYWYFHCNFQQHMALLLVADTDTSRLIQWQSRNCFFLGGGTPSIGLEVTLESGESLSYSKPTRGRLGRVVAPSVGPGAEPEPQTIYGRFIRNFMCFSAFGSWLLGIITSKTQENITWVGKVTLHA